MSEELIPVFIPSLSNVLLLEEDNKGMPLSQSEVISIRDNASCIMMSLNGAIKMEESRNDYIDPENCWYDWQLLRKKLGRKPDLDSGIKSIKVTSDDEAIQLTIKEAKNSILNFKQLIDKFSHEYSPMIKYTIEDNNYKMHMWLIVEEVKNHCFIASLFEVPSEFTSYKEGDLFEIEENEILDWMINIEGEVHGGYSLRYQREQLSEIKQIEFDEYTGIKTFC